MGVNELKKWNYAKLLSRPYNKKREIDRLQSLSQGDYIQFIIRKSEMRLPFHAIILDFEGNPVFMIGIMIDDTLLTFYIEDYEYRNELYQLLLNIFTILQDEVYFTFSDHEKEEIKKIYQYLEYQGEDLSKYISYDKIPIINLQLSKFESVLEALYSCHPEMKITGDALFRNMRLVNQLFYAKKFNEIVLHNHNCLENESIILKKRWLKLYTV